MQIEGNLKDFYPFTLTIILFFTDFCAHRITPSMSLTSPMVSQWTVNESSYGVQTMQTDNNWSIQHGDSFDSCKSNSNGEYFQEQSNSL